MNTSTYHGPFDGDSWLVRTCEAVSSSTGATAASVYAALGIAIAVVVVCFPAWLVSLLLLTQTG